MMNINDINAIFKQYEKCAEYKESLGERGITAQHKMNDRFWRGDQWHGSVSNSRKPLVRQNVIRRIGLYKQAMVASDKRKVDFAAKGVCPDDDAQKSVDFAKALGEWFDNISQGANLQSEMERALEEAYVSGTGAVYVYWDDGVKTGQYADEGRSVMITGDIACKAVSVDNIYFALPTLCDVEQQPFIIISSSMSAKKAYNNALKFGAKEDDAEQILRDAATVPEAEQTVTVLTKFYKKVNNHGDVTVHAVEVCKGGVIRPEWDLCVRKYPLCIMTWNERRGSVYGESEIEWLIPNQIAINRMLTASVWATMLTGMPMMTVNTDLVRAPVTNEPGQIISYSGECDEFSGAIRYVEPPKFGDNFREIIEMMINDTFDIAGASRAAIGSLEMNNAAAIESLQKAAGIGVKRSIRKFEKFLCDVALTFAEFMVCCYGMRPILLHDDDKAYYMPFNGEEYKDVILSAAVIKDEVVEIDEDGGESE